MGVAQSESSTGSRTLLLISLSSASSTAGLIPIGMRRGAQAIGFISGFSYKSIGGPENSPSLSEKTDGNM